LPFSRKVMAAPFPVFTMISRVARAEVCAGAIRVSFVTTGLPSAVSETQVVFSARICKVNVLGGFGAGAGVWMAGGLAFGWGGFTGGVVGAEMIADGGVSIRMGTAGDGDAAGDVEAEG